MSDAFTLHPRLAADTIVLGNWPLCRLLLMNDGRFPWVILVPARPDLREIHDLPSAERAILIEEIARASALMQQAFKADKMNVAALGNQVPQLHVHVIARFASDAAWPNPVWESTAPKMPKVIDSEGVLSGRVTDFYHALRPLLQACGPDVR
jgi:diadenosine tetraphosphate (Ap4A) HIT family hydrolase